MDETLTGRRILITRTRSQASSLAAELERLGAVPVLIPTIEIVPPSSLSELDAVVSNLEAFDWLLFTSANAVQAFMQQARKLGRSIPLIQIAAIGPATERALRTAGILSGSRPILLPPVAVAESLADALLPHVQSLLAKRCSAKLALIRAEVARDHLPETLGAAGAMVTVAPAYRNVLPAGSLVLLQQVLQDASRTPEAITFTSSSTATNFVDLLTATGLPLPARMRRISIGPVTSVTLRRLELPPHTEAEDPTIPSLVAAIQRAFREAR